MLAGAAGDFLIVGVDEERLAVGAHHRLVHHHLAHVFERWQLVHRVEQDLLEDGAQATRAGLARERAFGHGAQRAHAHFELDTFHVEQALVLLDERVLGLGEDLDEGVLVQLFQRREHGQTPDELGNETVLDEILGLDALQEIVGGLGVLGTAHFRAEADAGFLGAVTHDLLQSVERAAAHEQDVGGVHLDEILVRVLAAALRGHRGDRAFDQLQERLLHTFAGYVARDRGVVGLARDLVDLVDVDDAALRLVDIVVAILQELLNDVLDVLADVARLGERGCVRDDERNIQKPRQRLCEERLARAGRPDQQDVRLGELDLVVLGEVLEPLVVVVDRDRENLLRLVLADDVLVEDVADLARGRQVRLGALAALIGGGFLADDVVAKLDALVADEDRRAGDQLSYLVLALAAERAVKKLLPRGRLFGHLHVLPGRQHLVHDAVLYRVLGTHEKVALGVAPDDLDRLLGVLCKNFIQPLAQVKDLLGVDLDVGGLALEAAHRLMDHDARVGQGEALVRVARGHQQRAHAGGLADAQGRDVGFDELHGVVDRQSRRDRAARRVDVEEDVLVGILRLEEQELGHDQVRSDFIHRPDQEDHALLEQPGVDVVGALAAPGLLDDHGDEPQAIYFRRLFPVHELLPPISSSNVTGLSSTFAFVKTHLTTLVSSASDSISARRSRCM